MNDNKAIKAIEGLIDTLNSANIALPIEMPLIVSVTPIEVNDISALTEIYYQNKELTKFSALDETIQKDENL